MYETSLVEKTSAHKLPLPFWNLTDFRCILYYIITLLTKLSEDALLSILGELSFQLQIHLFIENESSCLFDDS